MIARAVSATNELHCSVFIESADLTGRVVAVTDLQTQTDLPLPHAPVVPGHSQPLLEDHMAEKPEDNFCNRRGWRSRTHKRQSRKRGVSGGPAQLHDLNAFLFTNTSQAPQTPAYGPLLSNGCTVGFFFVL